MNIHQIKSNEEIKILFADLSSSEENQISINVRADTKYQYVPSRRLHYGSVTTLHYNSFLLSYRRVSLKDTFFHFFSAFKLTPSLFLNYFFFQINSCSVQFFFVISPFPQTCSLHFSLYFLTLFSYLLPLSLCTRIALLYILKNISDIPMRKSTFYKKNEIKEGASQNFVYDTKTIDNLK